MAPSGIPLPGDRSEQNFPNPFNPTTEIGYQIPAARRVRLEICDVLGRHVTTYLEEEQSAERHVRNGLAVMMGVERL